METATSKSPISPIARKDSPRWLGGAAAMMAVTITHPIDQTKIRTQTQRPRVGMVQTARNTIISSGVPGLWAGVTGSYLRQLTYGMARFGTYAELNSRYKKRRKIEGKVPFGVSVGNGILAGVVAGLVGTPGEMIMVRMSGDGVRPPEKRFNYRNPLQGLYRVIKEDGMNQIFRGGSATVLRSALLNGSQLASYDLMKAKVLQKGWMKEGMPLHLLTACAAGTISVTLCAPADVMKSRIQVASAGKSASRVISDALRKEGFSVLFRGWLPAWLRMAPTASLTFAFMEQLRKLV